MNYFRGRKLTIDDLLKQDKPHPLQEVVDYMVKKGRYQIRYQTPVTDATHRAGE